MEFILPIHIGRHPVLLQTVNDEVSGDCGDWAAIVGFF
jgi:hypothetical protein